MISRRADCRVPHLSDMIKSSVILPGKNVLYLGALVAQGNSVPPPS